MEARMTRVIKETIFHPYHWMNGLSCHLRSPEIYVIIALNTPSFCFPNETSFKDRSSNNVESQQFYVRHKNFIGNVNGLFVH
jgi:hypothetical protein